MAITELGHTGYWVNDLATMRDFYERVIGLTVTDEDIDHGVVFFSSRPDYEHHEFVLMSGRTAEPGALLAHQVSWRLESLDDFFDYYERFKAEGTQLQQVVTHGNAFGIYFFDPEGNRGEVYWPTGIATAQPFRKSLNLDQPREAVLAEARALLAEAGPAYQPATGGPVLP